MKPLTQLKLFSTFTPTQSVCENLGHFWSAADADGRNGSLRGQDIIREARQRQIFTAMEQNAYRAYDPGIAHS